MTRGLYIYADTAVHRADPRAKLIFALMMSLSVLLQDGLMSVYCILLLILALSLYSVGPMESLMNFRRVLALVVCIFLCTPLQCRWGEPLLTIGSFTLVTREGLARALLINAKFLCVSYLFSVLLETTRLEVVVLALRSFRLPYSAALTLSIALSMIPTLSSAYYEVKDSMSLRINDEKRREGLLAVIVAVIVRAFKTVPETASGLEERGYGRQGSRTSYRSLGKGAGIAMQMILAVSLPLVPLVLSAISVI